MRPFTIFDEEDPKKYDIRTSLYGDVWFSKWELKIMHTRCFQKLYDIKQLGFADRVYPDATHCRFNHSLGVVEQSDRIIRWVIHNLNKKGADNKELLEFIKKNIDVIRIVALLHDVFHIPFGHTVEDELQFFSRHDEDTNRKNKILDAILAEILYWEYEAIFGVNRDLKRQFWSNFKNFDNHNIVDIVKVFHSSLTEIYDGLASFLVKYAKACEVLFFMGKEIITIKDDKFWGWDGMTFPLAHQLVNITEPTFDPLSEYYIVDVIGNTISADLLDYAIRDMKNTGLTASYDDRIFQYFTIVDYNDDDIRFSGTIDSEQKLQIRMKRIALNLFHKRIRIDALSEILQILNLRYLLTERVLFHRTKCSISAMLGKALELLNLPTEQVSNFMLFGDSEFLSLIETTATDRLQLSIKNEKTEEADLLTDALKLIHGIRSRHLYKPVFHMKSLEKFTPQDPTHPAKLLSNRTIRTGIEIEIEKIYGFPRGSVIIYCPKKTHLKEADCLVIVDSSNTIKKVKELKDLRGFDLYGAQADNVTQKYGILWNMYVFVPKRLLCFWKPIEEKIIELFNKYRNENEFNLTGIEEITQDDDLRKYLSGEKATVTEEYQNFLRKSGYDQFESIIRHEEDVTLNATTEQRNLEFINKPYAERVNESINQYLTAQERNQDENL